ncbi:MAG: class I SAM-dependent methyltransferase, partial [Rhodothermia bacterium]|nr:class I SAM-dependent methyltransferase [Rhodothermia bacterium]
VLDRVKLVHDSHDRMGHYLSLLGPSRISASLFNLGYLPGSDKSVVTRPETTIGALDAASKWLMPNGLISVVAYTGHDGGREEAEAVRDWTAGLPADEFSVMRPQGGFSGNRTPELTIIRRLNFPRTSCA